MSETTTGGQTAQTKDQPAHSFANIIDHPGSTYAGAAVALTAIGTTLNGSTMPTNATGWIMLAVSLLTAVLAALGK